MKTVDQSIAESVTKVNTKQPQERRHVWIVYRESINKKMDNSNAKIAKWAKHLTRKKQKPIVRFVAQVDLNETKVQQSVWIAYRENTKQKKGGQIVPTVLLAQHPPPLPTKNNVAHVAKAAINEQKVQQSV